MKGIKERWDMKYPEYQEASWQKLRDNAARFEKEPEKRNLILVRRRQEVEMDIAGLREIEPEVVNEVDPELQDNEIEPETDEAEVLHNMQAEEELSEADKELERFFQTELENLNRCTMLQLELREKLPKVLLSDVIQTRANKILEKYLRSADTISEIIDTVYTMGKSVGGVMEVKPKVGNDNRCRKAAGGNRREGKLKADMKELRQNMTRTGNELYRRIQQRKTSAKEIKILKNLKTKMNNKDVTSRNLRTAKEQWIDKLRYKKVKLEKFVEKRKRKQDNFMFHHDQKGFFRTLEADITREGEMPDMDKFVEFWGGIWEQNERTPNMPWMKEVKRELHEKVGVVSEFTITDESLKKEVA